MHVRFSIDRNSLVVHTATENDNHEFQVDDNEESRNRKFHFFFSTYEIEVKSIPVYSYEDDDCQYVVSGSHLKEQIGSRFFY